MLNKKQHNLYLWEWGQLQGDWRTAGLRATNSIRKQLQAQAIGRDISSKALTNRELDRVLYYFRTARMPGHIPAYRAISDSSITPTFRARYAARHLARRLKPDLATDTAADNYNLGTARNMHSNPALSLAEIDLATYQNICAAYTYRLRSAEAKLAGTEGIGWPKRPTKAQPAPEPASTTEDLSWDYSEDETTPAPAEAPEPAYAAPTEGDPF